MISDPEVFLKILIESKVNFFTGVPDSLLKELISEISYQSNVSDLKHLTASNEGLAVALAAGHYLGTGKLPVVYLQNSGLGNCINALTSLVHEKLYSIPLILIVGWRGEPNFTDEPQHIIMGQITVEILRQCNLDIIYLDQSNKYNSESIRKIINETLKRKKPVVFLVSKNFFKPTRQNQNFTSSDQNRMSRELAIESILKKIPKEAFVVGTTGMISREIYANRIKLKHSHERDFLNVGAMGHANSLALGLALSSNTKKIVIMDGDGANLMHLGGLAQIVNSMEQINNFTHIILNNESHDSVGGQPTSFPKISFIEIYKALLKTRNISSPVNLYQISNLDELKSLLLKLQFKDTRNIIEILVSPGHRSDLERPKLDLQNQADKFFTEFIAND